MAGVRIDSRCPGNRVKLWLDRVCRFALNDAREPKYRGHQCAKRGLIPGRQPQIIPILVSIVASMKMIEPSPVVEKPC
jgi:hypothetical protein